MQQHSVAVINKILNSILKENMTVEDRYLSQVTQLALSVDPFYYQAVLLTKLMSYTATPLVPILLHVQCFI